MHEKVQTFLTLFEIELNDLQKDIELLIERYREDHDKEVISNYVFLENIALMKNELFGIDSFRDLVRSIEPTDYCSTILLADDLRCNLRERCRSRGIAASIYLLAERKIRKILSYIEHQQEVPVS